MYHQVIIDLQKDHCETDEKMELKIAHSNYTVELCKKSYKICSIEGSCLIVSKDSSHLINVKSYISRTATTSWVELNINRCSSGIGMDDACLDPFYSIAADLTEYRLGDVIFVPSIKGILLPDGTIHTGYLVVRDTHELLAGAGADRIHFFTGTFSDTDPKNPFVKLKLDDPSTHLLFEKVTDPSIVKKAQKQRNFPLLPGVSSQEGVLK
jgi:hypothetical protein